MTICQRLKGFSYDLNFKFRLAGTGGKFPLALSGLSFSYSDDTPQILKNLNIDKIYLDAYEQVSTPSGEKYPKVTQDINTRVDRGAESPDKSWFSIARRNYKFYGFDIKMLDELYKTAAENGW